MTRSKILVAESVGFSEAAAGLLRQMGELHLADLDRPELLSAVQDADILWVRLRHRIDREVLEAAGRLKAILCATTGLDHIDIVEAERRGIRVLSLRGEAELLKDIRATAEHTVALILALVRKLPAAAAHVRQGGWNRDLFKGAELYGKTAGIIGYGRLGRQVARYLKAFEMRLLISDPRAEGASLEPGLTLLPLIKLLPQAEIVTLHVDLRSETRRFFGREQFAAMKPGAYFINTSRGELVDEEALQDALESGHLAGAALDVLSAEQTVPVAERALLAYAREHDNLLITPHLGGCTAESMEKTEVFLAQKLREAFFPALSVEVSSECLRDAESV